MGVKLLYNGQEMAHVDEKSQVVFTKGPDLNPMIDQAIGTIREEEDDMGNIIFEEGEPSLDLKLVYMVTELGFKVDKK